MIFTQDSLHYHLSPYIIKFSQMRGNRINYFSDVWHIKNNLCFMCQSYLFTHP